MFNRDFARDLAERVIATFAQALAALLIASGTGLLDTDWVTNLSVAGMTALVSLLKGVAAGSMDSETGASLLPNPPPRVERGQTDVVTILAIVALLAIILVLVGVLPLD